MSFVSNISWGSSEAILKALFRETESKIYIYFFLINFNLDFLVLAQKCLKPCLNSVLKLRLFFLNLSNKIPAGVKVRTSKYCYMEIFENLFWKVYIMYWSHIIALPPGPLQQSGPKKADKKSPLRGDVRIFNIWTISQAGIGIGGKMLNKNIRF